MSELLKASEAAKRLDVTEGTLAVWRATRRYNLSFVKVGRKVRYRPEDLENFLAARTHTGLKEPETKPRRRSRSRKAA